MSDPNAKIDAVAMQAMATHQQCTAIRAAAYGKLFGTKPFAVYAFHQLRGKDDGPFLIDVFCYPLAVEGREKAVLAVVTNGMSDQAMAPDQQRPGRPRRRELIQYMPECPGWCAQRLRDMAWLPLFDGFLLDARDTVAWDLPAKSDSVWKHAFFLEPIWTPHQGSFATIGGDEVSFLWHIPITGAELAFKKEHGANAFLDRMQEASLPWLFEETNRPALVPE
jgi:hypothetical protein